MQLEIVSVALKMLSRTSSPTEMFGHW